MIDRTQSTPRYHQNPRFPTRHQVHHQKIGRYGHHDTAGTLDDQGIFQGISMG
jgi:hypothetical protein